LGSSKGRRVGISSTAVPLGVRERTSRKKVSSPASLN
jgi:hypothetical protein